MLGQKPRLRAEMRMKMNLSSATSAVLLLSTASQLVACVSSAGQLNQGKQSAVSTAENNTTAPAAAESSETGQIRAEKGSVALSAESRWNTPLLLQNGDVSSLELVMNSSGNGMALWREKSKRGSYLNSRYYSKSNGWGPVTVVNPDGEKRTREATLAMDESGNIIAIWIQYGGNTKAGLYSSRYTLASGWDDAVLIATGELNHGVDAEPKIAMDASGNAVVIWLVQNGSRSDVWSNHYRVGTGWGRAVLIETADKGSASQLQLAVAKNGDAMALWEYGNESGSNSVVYSNRYSLNKGWGVAASLTPNIVGTAHSPQISMTANGSALAVWESASDNSRGLSSRFYSVGSGWGNTSFITDDGVSAFWPQIKMDVSGNAVAIWEQLNERSEIWCSRYASAEGWDSAGRVDKNQRLASSASKPQLSIDASGNVTAVWKQEGESTKDRIYSSRYIAGEGWSAEPSLISDQTTVNELKLTTDGSGKALVLWLDGRGPNSNIWGSLSK